MKALSGRKGPRWYSFDGAVCIKRGDLSLGGQPVVKERLCEK